MSAGGNVIRIVAVSSLLLISACSYIFPPGRHLVSHPNHSEMGINWSVYGGVWLTATFKTLSFEVVNIKVPSSSLFGGPINSFEIPVTAAMDYEVKSPGASDEARATVVFDLVSKNGTVVATGSSIARVRPPTGTFLGRTEVSGKIEGVSADALSRSAYVRARWDYGR